VSFAIAHPGLGPKRVASELGREKWGGIVVSPNGVWKVLCRNGLNTRAKRFALVAGYAAPYEPPRSWPRAAHRRRPPWRAGRDRLLLRRSPEGDEGIDLATDRDRHPIIVCLGRARDLQGGEPEQPERQADLEVRAAGGQGSGRSRLEARAPALRQRQRIQGRVHEDDRSTEGPPHPDPRRAPDTSSRAGTRRRSPAWWVLGPDGCECGDSA